METRGCRTCSQVKGRLRFQKVSYPTHVLLRLSYTLSPNEFRDVGDLLNPERDKQLDGCINSGQIDSADDSERCWTSHTALYLYTMFSEYGREPSATQCLDKATNQLNHSDTVHRLIVR